MSQGNNNLLPILKKEKSYREWRKAMSMWARVTDVEPAKRALVVGLNLSGKPREWALEMNVTELNREDGLTKLLNKLDRMHNRLETYRIYQKLDRLLKSPSQCMDEYLSNFRTLSSKAKDLGLAIPPSVLSYKLLAQSGLSEEDQENIFCQVEELTSSGITTALRYGQPEIRGPFSNIKLRERQDLRVCNKDAEVKDSPEPNAKPGPDVFWFQRSASDSTSPAFKFDLTMTPSTSKVISGFPTSASALTGTGSNSFTNTWIESRRGDKNSNEALLSFSAQPARTLERDVKQFARRLKDAQTQCSILATPGRREHRLRPTARRIERDLLGEDFEQVLFLNRAKLYSYGGETKTWKERGIGEVKILQNWRTHKTRILMRREEVFKVCLNHLIHNELKLVDKNDCSGKTLMWTAIDFSDVNRRYGEVFLFAVRFARATITQLFRRAWMQSVEASAYKKILQPEISALRTPAPTFSFAKSSITFTRQNELNKPAFFG